MSTVNKSAGHHVLHFLSVVQRNTLYLEIFLFLSPALPTRNALEAVTVSILFRLSPSQHSMPLTKLYGRTKQMAVSLWPDHPLTKSSRIRHDLKAVKGIDILATAPKNIWRVDKDQNRGFQKRHFMRKLVLIHELRKINIVERSYSLHRFPHLLHRCTNEKINSQEMLLYLRHQKSP